MSLNKIVAFSKSHSPYWGRWVRTWDMDGYLCIDGWLSILGWLIILLASEIAHIRFGDLALNTYSFLILHIAHHMAMEKAWDSRSSYKPILGPPFPPFIYIIMRELVSQRTKVWSKPNNSSEFTLHHDVLHRLLFILTKRAIRREIWVPHFFI